MIEYEAGRRWQMVLLCSCKGSVIPRALMHAVPATLLAVVLHVLNEQLSWGLELWLDGAAVGQIWAGYNFVLSFLLVFRTQNAYARFWEGGTHLKRMSAQWKAAVSSTFAFCTTDPAKENEVKMLQRRLCQLASLLHCMCLQEVALMEDVNFQILDVRDVGVDKLKYLATTKHERCGVVVQWIQKLIAHGTATGIVSAPAPIATRSFQELSLGLISFNEAMNIREIEFPFPYVQIVQVMLTITTIVAPFMNTFVVNNLATAACVTLISIAAFWSINHIAAEIEVPYGDDPNDLPINEIQIAFNDYLLMLGEHEMQSPPVNVPEDCAYAPLDTKDFSDIFRDEATAGRSGQNSGNLSIDHWHRITSHGPSYVLSDEVVKEVNPKARNSMDSLAGLEDPRSTRPVLYQEQAGGSREGDSKIRRRRTLSKEKLQENITPSQVEVQVDVEPVASFFPPPERDALQAESVATGGVLLQSKWSGGMEDEKGAMLELSECKLTLVEKQLVQQNLRLEMYLEKIATLLASDSDVGSLIRPEPPPCTHPPNYWGCGANTTL